MSGIYDGYIDFFGGNEQDELEDVEIIESDDEINNSDNVDDLIEDASKLAEKIQGAFDSLYKTDNIQSIDDLNEETIIGSKSTNNKESTENKNTEDEVNYCILNL